MERLVPAFPVLPGNEAEMRPFPRDLQRTRADQAAEFYASRGIAHESWYAQEGIFHVHGGEALAGLSRA
jgi:hypothetical protein